MIGSSTDSLLPIASFNLFSTFKNKKLGGFRGELYR